MGISGREGFPFIVEDPMYLADLRRRLEAGYVPYLTPYFREWARHEQTMAKRGLDPNVPAGIEQILRWRVDWEIGPRRARAQSKGEEGAPQRGEAAEDSAKNGVR